MLVCQESKRKLTRKTTRKYMFNTRTLCNLNPSTFSMQVNESLIKLLGPYWFGKSSLGYQEGNLNKSFQLGCYQGSKPNTTSCTIVNRWLSEHYLQNVTFANANEESCFTAYAGTCFGLVGLKT